MINVERSAEPLVLRRRKETWDRSLCAATTPQQKKRATSKYQHEQIKKALVQMFHGKCGYCESKINHIDYGHIEHFRPKSVPQFMHLVFEWKNMFLACAVCNGPAYKGDRFPGVDVGGPPVNPCDDIPHEHLDFVFDRVAKLASVVYKTERGRVTVELFGLNRPDLRAYRSRVFEKLLALSRFAATDGEARHLLEEAQSDDGEYAAFARTLPA
jgi:uncharacterized protein (TIGR02646 family)